MEAFEEDRLGLVLAFWGLGLVLGRPQVSQTDYTEDGETFGAHSECVCSAASEQACHDLHASAVALPPALEDTLACATKLHGCLSDCSSKHAATHRHSRLQGRRQRCA